MNKNILKDEIRELLEAIHEQFEALHSSDSPVPQIEYDMLLENIRKLYQDIHLLQRINDPYEYFEHKSQAGPTLTETPTQNVPEPGFTPVAEMPLKESEVQKKEKEHKKKEPGSGPDLFSSGIKTDFIEKLKEAREQTLGPLSSSPEPKELRSLITINDKFLFINELFDGNLRDYNENIDTLGGFSSLEQAMEYLDRLRNKNYWESTGKAFLRLKEVIDKRFG